MKEKFKIKSFIWLLLAGLILLGGGYAYIQHTVELSKADAAASVVINLSAAENQQFIKHRTYTYDWAALDKYLPNISKSQGFLGSAPKAGYARFFAFSAKEAAIGQDGFSLEITLNETQTAGAVRAVRRGGFISYTLENALPDGAFSCRADGFFGKRFCKIYTLHLKNLLGDLDVKVTAQQ